VGPSHARPRRRHHAALACGMAWQHSTDKTSLKADREVWGGGGGLTWNHFDFTSISLWHPLKPPQITVKTEGPSRTAPGDQRHQGNQRNPKIIRKTKDSLSIPLRTHAGSTREAPSSRRTTFYLISQTKSRERPKGRAAPHRSTNDNKKPSDRITHAGTIQISRLSKPPNLRYTPHVFFEFLEKSLAPGLPPKRSSVIPVAP